MSQHDYSIANQGFPATRADINNVLSAIATNNSGTSAPSTQYAGQFWIDTTSSTWTLYIHDGTDDIQFATIDTSANTVNFTDSALDVVTDTTPQLGGNLDLNSNDITGTGNINITGTGTFSGDLTVDTNTLYVDSTNNYVGIGTASPDRELTVGGVPNARIAIVSSDDNASQLQFGDSANTQIGRIYYEHTDNSMRFHTNVSERMRIDSSGNVGIGTSSTSSANLVIATNSNGGSGIRLIGKSANGGAEIDYYNNANSTLNGFLEISDTQGTLSAVTSIPFTFRTNNTERMRIDSSGNVFVNKTVLDNTVAGFSVGPDNYVAVVRSGGQSFIANRLTNDGALFSFRQNSTEEGTISVSGTTVSYNGFTGTHWSRFTDNSKPSILRGTVLESLDEMCDWYNLEFDITIQDEEGNDVTTTKKIPHVLTDTQSNGDVITYNHEGTDVQATIVKEGDVKHVKSKVSDTVDAKNVYGVFVAYDEDGEGYNDFYVASVGSFVVRIKANETIAKGDLLQSNGDGTAKVQTDDAVRSSSFAKVLSTTIIETYEDGSYLVPCSLMC